MAQGVPKLKPEELKAIETVQRSQLLEVFGLVTEHQLALLLGIDLKTMQNRPRKNKPPYTKVCGKRLYFRDDVIAFLRGHMVMDED